MRKNKTKDQFWYTLGSVNVIAMAYPIGTYLRADSMEDQILAVAVLVGDRKSTRLNSSHSGESRMPSSA